MAVTETEEERRKLLKRKFLLGGVVVGVLLSIGYVALNLAGRSLGGTPTPPDPLGVRFVNAFLILAACVLQASILGRLAGWLTGRKSGSR
jgi:hypothetical protein